MSDSTYALYSALGVKRTATREQIESEYEASKKTFDDAKRAYEVLIDVERRSAYDKKCAIATEQVDISKIYVINILRI